MAAITTVVIISKNKSGRISLTTVVAELTTVVKNISRMKVILTTVVTFVTTVNYSRFLFFLNLSSSFKPLGAMY